MRRTAFMVLVLGLSLAMTAKGAPKLLAQAGTTTAAHPRRSAPARPHIATKTARHRTAHTAGARTRIAAHRPVPSAACHAARTAGRGTRYGAARTRQVCGKTIASRPHQRLRVHQARKAPIPATELKSAILSTQGSGASAREANRAENADDTDNSNGASDAVDENAPIAATQPVSLSRKRAVIPPPMRGSLDSLERQNEKADEEGLERIEDEDDLADRIAHKLLVPVPASAALTVNGNLPENHRYCRPWTARFLADLARAHAAQFHGSLEVSSAVRTVAYQKRLMAVNGNAAAAVGDVVSPHLTGATIDIAKSGMSRQEIGWMRNWLLPLQSAGKIDVEEEFQQACFHITVYKSYVPRRPVNTAARAAGGQPGAGSAAGPATAPVKAESESEQPGNGPQKTVPPKSKQSDNNAPVAVSAQGQ